MNSKIVLLVIVVSLIIVLTAGIASAETVPNRIAYQGKLTNAAGTPLSGTYTVTFSLYDVASGGTAISTDTHSVTATNGLFTTTITVSDPMIIDGRALWLGVKVGSDMEMTPRQQILPVAYALGLRPGVVGASFITSQSGGPDALVPGVMVSSLFNYNPGIYVTTSERNSTGLISMAEGSFSDGIAAYAFGPSSDGIHGYSDQGVGVSGIGKEGAFFTTNQAGTSSDLLPGVVVETGNKYNPGLTINTTGDSSHGLLIDTNGRGSWGVRTRAWNDSSTGIYALTTGVDSPGVLAVSTGDRSPAVRGESAEDVGMYAKGKEGAFFSTNQEGISYPGNPGVNVSTSYFRNPGVRIETSGDYSSGVSAETYGSQSPVIQVFSHGDSSYAVEAITYGQDSPAIFGESMKSTGIIGFSANSDAIYAYTDRMDSKYGVLTPDIIRALNYETGSSDVAEYMPVTEAKEPGTVLVIGDDGRLQVSTTAYDTRVAGIVSTEPGISLGTREGGNPGEQLIALAGRVPCRVDASSAPIRSGDLLTTSDNPGHAMKAEPTLINGRGFYPDGAILGKAAGSLESGTGTIDVLVTLQ